MRPSTYIANIVQDSDGGVISMNVQRNDPRALPVILAEIKPTGKRPSYETALSNAAKIAARDRADRAAGVKKTRVVLELPAPLQ
jgi:hypothetical protein